MNSPQTLATASSTTPIKEEPLDLETDNENEFVLPAMEKYDEAVKERDEKKEKRIEEEQEAKIRSTFLGVKRYYGGEIPRRPSLILDNPYLPPGWALHINADGKLTAVMPGGTISLTEGISNLLAILSRRR
ncbi:hypothetical protein PRIPAC_71066 [Pristionchus pacificus]|uniref:Uncharacterized protein n=1 Tax=Pristionchus pacificus TaxID=54126 RepID=A0A2A6C0H0_PRIPA|nr:hypothetical protein PRIPAC_71066 [Pristionchus pacificus]|eukprot:PDM71609.1 hypothetical protein PRIPAC_38016 [Pristionchus pacificus]